MACESLVSCSSFIGVGVVSGGRTVACVVGEGREVVMVGLTEVMVVEMTALLTVPKES